MKTRLCLKYSVNGYRSPYVCKHACAFGMHYVNITYDLQDFQTKFEQHEKATRDEVGNTMV